MDTAENYRFNVGTFKCVAINDGVEALSVDKIVKDVPSELVNQALLEQGALPDGVPYYFNCLYIQTDQHHVLVDAGWGQGTGRRNGMLLGRLKEEGVFPADIDTIIITHGDIDHVGGILAEGNQLAFPHANYILLKEAWEFWSNEPLVAKWPPFLTVFGRQMLPLIRDRSQVVEAGVEFLPGFQLLPVAGHRPGHTAVAITSSDEYLLHLADTVGHLLLLEHATWHCAFDFQPDQAVKARGQLLSQVAARRTLIFGSHLPFPGVGQISPQEDGWRWQPLAQALA